MFAFVLKFLPEASDPRKAAKRKVTNDFEISADGKLIIPNEDERQEPGDKRKRKQGMLMCILRVVCHEKSMRFLFLFSFCSFTINLNFLDRF